MSPTPSIFCMVATPFKANGSLDEEALRVHLRRMVDAGNDVYLGSGGAGEAHAMSYDELRRVYAIGVSGCKGKVKTYANPREARTADDMYALARIASCIAQIRATELPTHPVEIPSRLALWLGSVDIHNPIRKW